MENFVFEGIVAAPFLPMNEDESIDWKSLQSYYRWIAAQRPTAIAINMDASEGSSLTREEQLEVLRATLEAVDGACPVLSGVELYREIQKIALEDAPYVTLIQPKTYAGLNPAIKGYAIHPIWFVTLARLSR